MGGFLKLLNDMGEVYFSTDRYQIWKNLHKPKIFDLEEYFPSVVKKQIDKLVKKGQAEVKNDGKGVRVKITEKGKQELFKHELNNMVRKTGEWDGQWRVVFFDVEEIDRKSRDKLRFYLRKMGLISLQRSVWVSPFDITPEVKRLREILNIPYDVRMGVLSGIEYEGELKKWFRL